MASETAKWDIGRGPSIIRKPTRQYTVDHLALPYLLQAGKPTLLLCPTSPPAKGHTYLSSSVFQLWLSEPTKVSDFRNFPSLSLEMVKIGPGKFCLQSYNWATNPSQMEKQGRNVKYKYMREEQICRDAKLKTGLESQSMLNSHLLTTIKLDAHFHWCYQWPRLHHECCLVFLQLPIPFFSGSGPFSQWCHYYHPALYLGLDVHMAAICITVELILDTLYLHEDGWRLDRPELCLQKLEHYAATHLEDIKSITLPPPFLEMWSICNHIITWK